MQNGQKPEVENLAMLFYLMRTYIKSSGVTGRRILKQYKIISPQREAWELA